MNLNLRVFKYKVDTYTRKCKLYSILGVSKSTLQNAISKLKMLQYEILALSEMKDKSKLRDKIQEIITSISFLSTIHSENMTK